MDFYVLLLPLDISNYGSIVCIIQWFKRSDSTSDTHLVYLPTSFSNKYYYVTKSRSLDSSSIANNNNLTIGYVNYYNYSVSSFYSRFQKDVTYRFLAIGY